jgi:4,4'-diaponeurosporenoate glycosyltransferase
MAVLTVIFVLYFLLLVVLMIGWKRSRELSAAGNGAKEPLISVVIPVRNEEETIGNLLTTLSAQEYRNFEIIIVNDDSQDETLWAISQLQI